MLRMNNIYVLHTVGKHRIHRDNREVSIGVQRDNREVRVSHHSINQKSTFVSPKLVSRILENPFLFFHLLLL